MLYNINNAVTESLRYDGLSKVALPQEHAQSTLQLLSQENTKLVLSFVPEHVGDGDIINALGSHGIVTVGEARRHSHDIPGHDSVHVTVATQSAAQVARLLHGDFNISCGNQILGAHIQPGSPRTDNIEVSIELGRPGTRTPYDNNPGSFISRIRIAAAAKGVSPVVFLHTLWDSFRSAGINVLCMRFASFSMVEPPARGAKAFRKATPWYDPNTSIILQLASAAADPPGPVNVHIMGCDVAGVSLRGPPRKTSSNDGFPAAGPGLGRGRGAHLAMTQHNFEGAPARQPQRLAPCSGARWCTSPGSPDHRRPRASRAL
jgi:hypothetical protein